MGDGGHAIKLFKVWLRDLNSIHEVNFRILNGALWVGAGHQDVDVTFCRNIYCWWRGICLHHVILSTLPCGRTKRGVDCWPNGRNFQLSIKRILIWTLVILKITILVYRRPIGWLIMDNEGSGVFDLNLRRLPFTDYARVDLALYIHDNRRPLVLSIEVKLAQMICIPLHVRGTPSSIVMLLRF